MAVQISASVGMQGGVNRPEDVILIQERLNRIPPDKGGPVKRVLMDGVCGTETEKAIQKFQLHHFGWPGADGRVDPGGQTLAKMNAIADQHGPVLPGTLPPINPNTSSPRDLAESENKPIAVAWITTALWALEGYKNSIAAGHGNIGGVHDITVAALETNFAWRKLPSSQQVSTLDDIIGNYKRVMAVLRDSALRFRNAPPDDDGVAGAAYQDAIYFAGGFRPYDQSTDSGYGRFSRTAVVIHESVHVVDFESGKENMHISEFDEPAYSNQEPEEAKHNASAYATFASQVFENEKHFPVSKRYGLGDQERWRK